MPVSVTMPRLGESVTEGTVTRWLKQEGERVEADEPLLEVSTDKVDTEIPSPAAGVLSRIVVGEDETADVGSELVRGSGVARRHSIRSGATRPSPSRASTMPRWSGNCSTVRCGETPRSAAAVAWSVPGARPMPRSIRFGCRASSSANCSATTNGMWLGSITPPEPSRIRRVFAARCAISTGGEVDATAGMLWCSATQNRE